MENQVVQSISQATVKPATMCVFTKQDGQVEKLVDLPLSDYLTITAPACVAWIDVTTPDVEKDLEKIAGSLGFTQLPLVKVLSGFFSSYEDVETELGLMLPSVIVKDFEVNVKPLVVMLRGNLVVTVHSSEVHRLMRFARYAPTFVKKIKAEARVDKASLILERIIDENNDRNFEYLREIEKHGDDISRRLIDEEIDKRLVAEEIYKMKHVLITYLNVLWASKDVVESLRYGDADLITDDDKLLGRIGILSDNIERHIELSEQMSNVLASGLEVMQTIYNNKLQTMNNRFAIVTAYLTVFGTAFLWPNTIATVVSSMGWDLSGVQLEYMLFLIISTIIATIGSFAWVWNMWYRSRNDTLGKRL